MYALYLQWIVCLTLQLRILDALFCFRHLITTKLLFMLCWSLRFDLWYALKALQMQLFTWWAYFPKYSKTHPQFSKLDYEQDLVDSTRKN